MCLKSLAYLHIRAQRMLQNKPDNTAHNKAVGSLKFSSSLVTSTRKLMCFSLAGGWCIFCPSGSFTTALVVRMVIVTMTRHRDTNTTVYSCGDSRLITQTLLQHTHVHQQVHKVQDHLTHPESTAHIVSKSCRMHCLKQDIYCAQWYIYKLQYNTVVVITMAEGGEVISSSLWHPSS